MCQHQDSVAGLGTLGSLLPQQVSGGKSKSTMRALKYRRRYRAQRLTKIDPKTKRYPGSKWCGLPLKDDVVELVETEGGGVMPSQVQFCKAVWVCPVCGAIIRQQRGKDIEKGVNRWHMAGGGVYFVTVTIRHSRSDSLKSLLDLMTDAWRRTVSGRIWAGYRDDWGLVGYTRTLEMTYSLQNGWHPHFHFLYFTDEPANDQLAATMRQAIYDRFTACLARAGAKAGNIPNLWHGVDVQPVTTNGKVLGVYVSKLGSIAAEVSASQTKQGRLPGHLDPFQLLDINQDWAKAAWQDYASATKGKRSIYFSRDMREKLGIADKDDEKVVDDALEGKHDVVCAVDAAAYIGIIDKRQAFDELDRALTHAANGNWNDAAAALSLSLSRYVDVETGVVVPLLC
jgi:hypothetical protein